MPWLATDAVKERTKFVLKWRERFNEAEGGRVNVAELCRMFGISRQTGYEWIGRYRESGKLDSLVERSRRPLSSPTKVSEEVEAMKVSASSSGQILDVRAGRAGSGGWIQSGATM